MLYWLLKSVLLGPLLRAIFRPTVEGLDHIPEQGGAILASNHLSFSDSFFLPLVVDRRITFLAKSDYFTGPGLKGRLTAGFFRGVGQVPVDRTGGNASEGALLAGLRILNAGQLLGIYPEGTRSPDGRLYRGKTGMARMALEARVPVLPVAMLGTDKVQPTGQKIPNLGQVGIRIGAPLDFSRYEGMAEDRTVLRSITDEVMYELMKLSGQEYVDVYAATMKEQLAEAVRERVAVARARAQAAATAASARAAEARSKVEEARARVEVDARARVEEGRAIVGEARTKLDQTRTKMEEEARARVEEARARLDQTWARAEEARAARAEARAEAKLEEAAAKVADTGSDEAAATADLDALTPRPDGVRTGSDESAGTQDVDPRDAA